MSKAGSTLKPWPANSWNAYLTQETRAVNTNVIGKKEWWEDRLNKLEKSHQFNKSNKKIDSSIQSQNKTRKNTFFSNNLLGVHFDLKDYK